MPSPSDSGSGVGALETTTQPSGAVTWKVKTLFRSGCSKVAKTRRASGTSNWRVGVDPVVGRVDEAVQALARAGVGAVGRDHELVARLEVGEPDPVVGVDLGRVERARR